jgi:uncharacterized surface protein with fasciclin (FAS1) repeats
MMHVRTPLAALAVGAILTLSQGAVEAQERDIVETAVAAGSFETLAAALDAAGLVATLRGDGPFTVFAPTDAAFARLPEGTVESLLRPENRDRLTAILTYHVVPGRVTAEEVVRLDRAATVNGAEVRIRTRDGGVQVDDADVVTTDVFASNGVIHVIDEVLLPPEARGEDDRDGAVRMALRSARGPGEAREILHLAIARGVPLFNRGQVAGTVGIYEVAAAAVLAADFGLEGTVREALREGLREGRRTHGLRERAWVYRGALDRALDALEGRMVLRTPDRH